MFTNVGCTNFFLLILVFLLTLLWLTFIFTFLLMSILASIMFFVVSFFVFFFQCSVSILNIDVEFEQNPFSFCLGLVLSNSNCVHVHHCYLHKHINILKIYRTSIHINQRKYNEPTYTTRTKTTTSTQT
jgi:hypothetical protein